ncbi:MAG: response regulator [Verrucomicrobiota bacterium]
MLVATEHDLNRRLSLLSLVKLGCRADAVASGKEALEQLQRQPYDVVLFDMRLADMDGSALAAVIREREKGGERTSPGPIRLVAVVDGEVGADLDHRRANGIDAALGTPTGLPDLKRGFFGTTS